MDVKRWMAKEYQTAEYFLINYDYEAKKYEADLEDFLTGERKEAGVGGRGGVGDPTGVLAVKRVEFERSSDAFYWLSAVKAVESDVSDLERVLIKWRREFDKASKYRRRGRGRPPWIINVVARFATEQDRLVSDFTIRKVWSNLVRLVVFAMNKKRMIL